jgi:hypothetical protein
VLIAALKSFAEKAAWFHSAKALIGVTKPDANIAAVEAKIFRNFLRNIK